MLLTFRRPSTMGFDAVLAAIAARDRLDEQIMMVAVSPRFADPVNRLVNHPGFDAQCR
jgi:hypothetical protein